MSAKKLSVTIIILCIAIVLSLSSMVVVLVVSGQKATSLVNISYTSSDVSVKLSATSYMIGETASTFREGGNSNGSTIVHISPENPTASLSQVDDLVFTADETFTVFEYRFENETTDTYGYIDLDLSQLTLNNVKLKYAYSYGTPLTSLKGIVSDNTYQRQLLGANATDDNKIVYIYISAWVIDDSVDASIEGNFNFNMARTVDNDVAQVSITQVSLNGTSVVNGSAVTKDYLVGDKIYEPQWQNLNNKRFNGWYLDLSLNTPASFPITLSSDITLYPAYQTGNVPSDYYVLSEDNSSYTIMYVNENTYSSITTSSLIIPDLYNNLPVTSIDAKSSDIEGMGYGMLANNTYVTHLYFGNNITYIGTVCSYATIPNFSDDSNRTLQFVELGRGIVDLNTATFAQLSALTTLRLPCSLQSVRETNTMYNSDGSYFSPTISAFFGSQVYSNNSTLQCYNNTESYILINNHQDVTNPSTIANWDKVACIASRALNDFDYVTESYEYIYKTTVTSITLPESLTVIGGYAFSGMTSLTNITIPDSIVSIGEYAFYNCTNLTSINLPDSVVDIGTYAFCNCSNLTSIKLPKYIESLPNYLFYSCSKLINISIPKTVTSIGSNAFYYCSSLTNIELPEGITKISSYLFGNCSNLRTVNIPNSVTVIDPNAFHSCTSLTGITIPEGVVSIGGTAFYNTALVSLHIPSTVTTIREGAFRDISSLNNISVHSNNATYDSRDNCNAIIVTATNELLVGSNNSTIPSTVTAIGNYAFSKRTGLTSIIIPQGVTKIGVNAFNSCYKLREVSLPNSIINIESSAFTTCSMIEEIVIPSSVTTIGSYAFSGCTNLISITIGEGVTSIGSRAFYNTTNLRTLNYNAKTANNLTSGNYVFYRAGFNYTGGVVLNIGANVTKIPNYMFCPYSTANVSYGIRLASVNFLGTKCTAIGNYAFAYNVSLPSISIPNSVQTIGNYTFYYCTGLTSATLGNNVKSLGNYAFNYCTKITNITIPASMQTIGAYAFYGCTALKTGTMTFEDTSWYKASISTASTWVAESLTNPTQNAIWFVNTSGYYNHYWKNEP